MLNIIKMNKKQPFEAFRIPEDGIVDLVELSSWVGNNGINISSIKPGHYIVKDMDVRSSRVSIIDEETLYNSYDIEEKIIDEKVSSKIPSNLDLKGKFLLHNGAYCPSCYCNSVELYENGEKRCTICAWNLTKGEHEPFKLSDACERLHYTRMLCPNCNNVHGILLRESINLFELSDACESLHHTRMLCPNCDNDHGILLRESINLFELSDENDVKKPSGCEENKGGLNV